MPFFLGGCAIRNQVELPDIGVNVHRTSIQLVTDRNDGGKNFRGVDFDVHFVQSCPAINCASEGGSCNDGLCICSNSIACNCTCESIYVDSTSTNTGIVLGVSCAVVLLLVILLLYCHQKKKRQY